MFNSKTNITCLGIILLVAVNNNCFEFLTNHNIKASQTLFYRGVFTLIFCSVIALIKKDRVFPVKIKEQSIRFITTGGSLLLVLMSYAFLSAGTVSLLQRLDIPFLIFVSLALKKKKRTYQIVLSVITILSILSLTINPEIIDEDLSGFILVFGSVLMTAIGYFTVHKGSNSESVPALINVSAISSIFFGLVITIFNSNNFAFPLIDFLLIALSALINVLLFYLAVRLYRMYEPEKALLPFVWAIITTSIIEMIIERKMYSNQDIMITVGLTTLITLICLGGQKLSRNNEQIG
jgi:drug/metabolite transporter (DMT)-like permease